MLHLHPRSELQQVRFPRFPHWSALNPVICEITAPQWWPVILTLSFLFFVYIWDVVAMLWPFPYKSRIRNTTRAPRCHNVHILYRVENNTGVLLGAWFYSLCNIYNGRLIVDFYLFTCYLVWDWKTLSARLILEHSNRSLWSLICRHSLPVRRECVCRGRITFLSSFQ